MLAEPRTVDGAPPSARRGWRLPELDAITPDVWLVAAITVIAALLRLATITSQSFWIDEATTVHEVGLSFGGMLHAVSRGEATPPLYFAAAWVWTRVFGAGELGIRSLSALAGIATIPVVYLCGRELVSRSAGVIAAALAATSPFLIWYSQEARCYMLLGLLSGLSVLYAARAVRLGSRRELGLWALCAALALATHFFAVLLVAAEAVWVLWARRDRAAVVAAGAIALTGAALLPLAIGDASHSLDLWISGLPRSSRIEQIPVDFAVSQLYRSSGLAWGLRGAAILTALVLALLWRGGGTRERRGALLAGALAAVVILLPIAAAELGRDYVFSRNMMPAWIPLAVVLGAACSAPRARWAGACLAVLLVVGFVWANATIEGNPLYQRPDWRGVAAALGTSAGPRAVFAADGNAAEEPLAVYLPRAQFTGSGLPPGPGPWPVTELDVVGGFAPGTLAPRLPPGVHRMARAVVDGYLVERFALSPGRSLTTGELIDEGEALLGSATATPSVLIVR